MYVDLYSVVARSGSEAEVLAFMEDRARRCHRAQGCYSAYALRESDSAAFSCMSLWVDRPTFLKYAPEGPADPSPDVIVGRVFRQTFESAEEPAGASPIATFVGIRVKDIERSARFYGELFGFEPITELHTHPVLKSRVLVLRHPKSGLQLELNSYPPDAPRDPAPPSSRALDHLGVRVPDVDTLVKSARSLSGKATVLGPFGEFRVHVGKSGTRISYVLDPDGNRVEVYDVPGYAKDGPFVGGY